MSGANAGGSHLVLSGSDPVPAIREADATGEVAAIFADIRAVFGVGVVNLVWRHLAMFEGALPWAWGSLRPLYASGQMMAAAARLRAALPLPTLPKIPPEVLAAAGVPPEAWPQIAAILNAYDRTNPMALVALTLLRESLTTRFPPSAPPALAPADDTPALALPLVPPLVSPRTLALPPLPDMAHLAPDTAALVLRLNRIGAGPDPILASMYRHLAYWPGFLALVWAVLAPLDVPALIAAGQVAAKHEAASLSGLLEHRAAPPNAPLLAAALERFTSDAIGRMVPICGVLLSVSRGLQTASSSP